MLLLWCITVLVVTAASVKADEVPEYIVKLVVDVEKLKQENLNLQESNKKILESNKKIQIEMKRLEQENHILHESTKRQLEDSNKKFIKSLAKLQKENQETIKFHLEDIQNKTGKSNNENFAGFSAYTAEVRNYNDGDTVVFDTATGNYGGHYSTTDGTFTCPVTGFYVFSTTFYSLEDKGMDGEIYLENVGALMGAYSSGDHDQSSTMAITQCQANQRVWIQCTSNGAQMHPGFDSRGHWSSFSGALLAM